MVTVQEPCNTITIGEYPTNPYNMINYLNIPMMKQQTECSLTEMHFLHNAHH